MSEEKIPAMMRALELSAYDGRPESLRLVERAVPLPRRGEVLVRVEAATVNPSDLMFLRGMYGHRKKLPVVAGFEGAGRVVSSGGGVLGRVLTGRRVACAAPADGDGTWAEYVRTPAGLCIPLRKGVTVEQGAAMIVNPFTAYALMAEVRRGRDKAVVQTAAASALGRMINRLALRRGVPLVNIVRRDEQAELLRGEGAQHVLNSETEDFEARLKELCRELKVTLAFDAVAGQLTGQLMRAMHAGGRVFVYGALSLDACLVDPRGLIFERKQVRGFWLSDWLRAQNTLSKLVASARVQKLLGTDLQTEIRARLPLEQAAEGLRQYAANMTGGKILFVPSQPKQRQS